MAPQAAMIALFSRLAFGMCGRAHAPARARAATPADARAVAVFPDCFAAHGRVVRWDAVARVRACKLARFGWDELCLEVQADGMPAALRLRERDRGFDEFVAMADLRMNFPLAWWSGLPVRGSELENRCDAAVLFERLARD